MARLPSCAVNIGLGNGVLALNRQLIFVSLPASVVAYRQEKYDKIAFGLADDFDSCFL